MKHRCKNCFKLLAVGRGCFEIKCPRCKSLNHFKTQ
ncbi:zinc finger domain-containing protein [Neisseria sp. S1]